MSVPISVKEEISLDWINAFSGLSAYSKTKLYKILGPVIIGMELLNTSGRNAYRPHLVCYPLWKTGVGNCFEMPFILQQYYNKKGLQLNIPYLKHSHYFEEAVECIIEQSIISFSSDVNFSNFQRLIEHQFLDILITSNPVGQARLYELKFYLALYLNNIQMVNKVLEEVKLASKNWAPHLFEWKNGPVKDWLAELENRKFQRDEILEQIKLNLNDKKLKKLTRSELISG